MRKILILLVMVMSVSLPALACAEQESDTTAESAITTRDQAAAPEWVKKLIADLEAAPEGNQQGMVVRYEYRGRTVYYVPAVCCDQLSSLYDEEGNVICSPDGGVNGMGDGRCPDFFDARKGEEVIWQG